MKLKQKKLRKHVAKIIANSIAYEILSNQKLAKIIDTATNEAINAIDEKAIGKALEEAINETISEVIDEVINEEAIDEAINAIDKATDAINTAFKF